MAVDRYDIDWQHAHFATEAEALAFAEGLTYGDEPLYVVDEVKEEREGIADPATPWAVIFCYGSELSDA